MSRLVSIVAVLTFASILKVPACGDPPPMETTFDVAYGPDPAQKLDVYRPKGATDARPAVIWFHGGGWQAGDKGDDQNGIRDLAPVLVEHGYVAFSCNYRLAPAHRHPAQVDDAARAVRWVRAHAGEYGVDPARVGVVGISAGGHLACMLAVHAPKTGDEALDRFPGTADAAVSLNGVSDLRPGAPTNALLQRIYPVVVGDDPGAPADMSPITFVTRGAAPLLLVVGEKDNMVPIAQSRIMADALKEAGADCELVVIPGAGHGIFPSSTPEARDAAVAFFDRRLKPGRGSTLTQRAGAADAAEGRPNIVYMVSDELAYFEPAFMGGKLLKTPNMDRLAARGVVMRNMLSGASVCAPARGALLTGKHSGHGSVRDNSANNALRAEEKTIAELLRPLGYAVGGFGKWGVGGRDSTGVPEEHGFDVFLGYYDQTHAHTYYPPYIIRNSEEVPLAGNHGGVAGRTYSQYVIHDAAMGFIRAHAGKRPFFAYLPYNPPHGFYDIPETDPAWAIYKDEPWSKDARSYAAMVTMVDRQLGEVLDLLDERGVAKNTIVFFSGDNGSADRFADRAHPRGLFSGNKDPDGPTEYRGGKGSPYEGSLRIPFVVSWPGKIRPGRASEHLGYFPDVMPTLAEVVGASPPPDVDGVSFLPELIGEEAAGRKQAEHDFLYWERAKWVAIRQGDWRAVKPGKGSGRWELYNVADDPSESKDVAAENPDILSKLTTLAIQAHEPQRPGSYTTRERADRDHRVGMKKAGAR